MLIEQALMTYLLAQTTITAYVGRRIYFVEATQPTEQPYMVISKISGVRLQSHEANTHLAHPRFQFTVFAEAYSDAKGCISALQTSLQGYSGTMGGVSGVVVGGAFYDDETDLDRGDKGLYGVAADYIILHGE
uniref:DUF3168 domain-containing protein n=1 Tax=viral metagenome TaxID=1070528 RepID=A0A6M3JYL9_9ZZZZ